ncbi:hypothetical protein RIF29_15065 [Crotalaria pallida]|uniref:Uncharacterized protein n=1 Tax=Crotalaria pallida TaxID=3830 RepID=A0AAN9FEY7_CROPI
MDGAMDESNANHGEEEVPLTVDATAEDEDNVTYIHGKGDIGVVDFTKIYDVDDIKKFRFADNELAYAFYNTYGLVEGWLETPPLTVYKVCKYCNEDYRWERRHGVCSQSSEELEDGDDVGNSLIGGQVFMFSDML